jgi:AcrR family transcriptional regulator
VAQPSNRDALVKGTMKCLLTKGYARTTARDIAAASGANLASIGYHFGSKEALLNEALIRLFERRNRQVGKLAVSGEDRSPLGFLTATFAAADQVFAAPRPVFVALLEAVAQAEHSTELRDQMAAHYQDARERIANTVTVNLGTDHPEVMASFLMAVFDGLVIQWLLDPERTPRATELADALIEAMTVVLDSAGKPAGRDAKRRSRRPVEVAT